MEALEQLEGCDGCQVPLYRAEQPGKLLCGHAIVCKACQVAANWSPSCRVCQQTWGYAKPDSNLAQWQANIQCIQSWGLNEHTDAYFQQQVEFFNDWRTERTPSIPALSVPSGMSDSALPAQQPRSLPDLDLLEVRNVGEGTSETWKCDFCDCYGNHGQRCIACNRVNFQAIACEPLPADIMALLQPGNDLSLQEVRGVGEITEEAWQCGFCDTSDNRGPRCITCHRVNFQAVPCPPLPEDIMAIFEAQTAVIAGSDVVSELPPPQSASVSHPPFVDPQPYHPQSISSDPIRVYREIPAEEKKSLLNIEPLEVRRIGETDSKPWKCCCGQTDNWERTCKSCRRVNFLEVPRTMIPATVTAVIRPELSGPVQEIQQAPKFVRVPKFDKAESSKSVQPDLVSPCRQEKDKEPLVFVPPRPLPPVVVDINRSSQAGVAKKQAPSRAEQGVRQIPHANIPIEERKIETGPGHEPLLNQRKDTTIVEGDGVKVGCFERMCNLL